MLVAQLEATGSVQLVFDPRSGNLSALLAGNGSSLTHWAFDRVSVAKQACPPGQFRSDTNALCRVCSLCPPLVDEAVPCATETDRVCGSSLVVGFKVEGVSFLSQPLAQLPGLPYFDQVIREDIGIETRLIPCKPGQFRDLESQLCRACTTCRPGEPELRACAPQHDRWCAGAIQVNLEVLGSAGVDMKNLDLTALQARLSEALALSDPFPVQLPLPYTRHEHHTMTVTPMPCPPGAYIDTGALVCRACSVCGSSQYRVSPCDIAEDTRCANCTVCGLFDAVLHECSETSDRVCVGALSVEVHATNATRLDQSLLSHALLGPLLKSLPPGASVDAGYLQHWNTLFSPITGSYVGYDLEAAPLNCSDEEYMDLEANACMACSVCASTAYRVSACTNQSDAVCAECNVCAPGQYEACPCGVEPGPGSTCPDANRICYAYAGVNVTVQVRLLSRYDASTLMDAYLPMALAFVRGQTLASYVELRVTESSPFQSPVVLNPDGSLSVTVEAGLYRLYELQGYQLTGGGPYVHTLNLTLAGLFAQQPNDALDFTVLLERALYHSDSAFVQGAPDSMSYPLLNQSLNLSSGSGNARRLRQLDIFCSADTYPAVYPNLGQFCTPCQDDPVLSSTPDTPQALRWAIADQPCPVNYARKCYGGTAPPMCIARIPAALILTSSSWPVVPLGCPSGQKYEADPGTGYLICVGIPCGPGQYGPAGYCKPCARGYYKSTTGFEACTACPVGTFSFLPGQTDPVGCRECPLNTWSKQGSSVCACNAGYDGEVPMGFLDPQESPCNPCAAGTYKLVWGTDACRPCYPGGKSSAQVNKQCTVCLPGTYTSAYGQSVCDACAAGEYQNRVGATACRPCDVGYASLPFPPLTYCVGCLVGQYAPAQGLSACWACPRGSYSFGSAATCTLCPNGTEVLTDDGQTCKACAQGTAGVAGVCDPCPPETYSSNLAATACMGCEAGTYTTGFASVTCDACPPGYTGLRCLACAQGFYATGSALTTCYQCARGLYTSAAGATSGETCQPCPEGFYWKQGEGCLACPANTVAPFASMSIRECLAAPGYFGPPGQPAAPCPPDHYCPRAAMSPVRCPADMVAPQASESCLEPKTEPTIRQYDWVVLGSWFGATFLGVAFVVRNRRFWRSQRRVGNFRRNTM